ncbi:hypothetical protein LCGC14_2898430 [marine sediment metagenome]|uniref:DUF5681 domain-containing protein n=1 Tax=marine sediment metagenome TaxID=412755 RepID=A0A0F9A322_9ZZZZ
MFKKGKEWKGNAKGRPKGSGMNITSEIKAKLLSKPNGKDGKTYLQLLIDVIIEKAVIERDTKTIEQMWKYIDGLPKQSIELDGEEVAQLGVILFPKKKEDV